MNRNPWNDDAFTPAELAALAVEERRTITINPASVVIRDRPSCPKCGALRFKITTTRTASDGTVTRYCECPSCRWNWKLIDIPAL